MVYYPASRTILKLYYFVKFDCLIKMFVKFIIFKWLGLTFFYDLICVSWNNIFVMIVIILKPIAKYYFIKSIL